MARAKKASPAVKSSAICRTVLDTQSVVKLQINTTLIEELVSNNTITRGTFETLSGKLQEIVDKQTDGLVDRILNEFKK